MSRSSTSDHQRVAGWLALTTQKIGGPLYGLRVEYTIPDSGEVIVDWRRGPTATAVAADLVRAGDPDLPIQHAAQASATVCTPLRADLLVGGVPVVLRCLDPRPERPRMLGEPDPWSWPQPLAEDGAALDSVLWHITPDSGGVGAAVVIRLPSTAMSTRRWREDGILVVDTEHVVPEHAATYRHSQWRQADGLADIRMRAAAPGWSVEDADGWLARTLASRTRRPAAMTAVVLPGRCVLCLRNGLRIEATIEDPLGASVNSAIPAAVLSSLGYTDDRRYPPALLIVRAFGDCYSERRIHLHTTRAGQLR